MGTDRANTARDDPAIGDSGDGVLLAGGTVITMNAARDVLRDGAVFVRRGRIVEVGSRTDLVARYPRARLIDCAGRCLIPGLVNTHTHLFQTLLKGLGDDLPRAAWGARGIRASAARLTSDDVFAAARHGAVESIRSGVTTILDFAYGNPNESMTVPVLEALNDVGIRGVVARTFVTAETPDLWALREDPHAAVADAHLLSRRYNSPSSLVRVALGPSMIWGVDEETLLETRRVALETGALVTMHIAETRSDRDYAYRTFGVGEVQLLERIGLLDAGFLAVHCVHCDVRDLRVLAAHDVSVSHNPCSNLYLGAGIAPVAEMLALGVNVALGTDGASSNNNLNLVQTMKFAALLQKGRLEDGSIMSAEQVLEMATIGGAAAVGLSDEIGSLEVGKRADVVVLRLDGLSVTPLHDEVSALVYSAIGDEPELVMIDGTVVMADGRVLSVDEGAIRAQAQTHAEELSARAQTRRRRSWPIAADR